MIKKEYIEKITEIVNENGLDFDLKGLKDMKNPELDSILNELLKNEEKNENVKPETKEKENIKVEKEDLFSLLDKKIDKLKELTENKNELLEAKRKLDYYLSNKKRLEKSISVLGRRLELSENKNEIDVSKLENFKKQLDETNRVIESKLKLINEDIPAKEKRIKDELEEYGKKYYKELLEEEVRLADRKFKLIEEKLYPLLNEVFEEDEKIKELELDLLNRKNKLSRIYSGQFTDNEFAIIREKIGLKAPKLNEVKKRQFMQYIIKGKKYLDIHMNI